MYMPIFMMKLWALHEVVLICALVIAAVLSRYIAPAPIAGGH